MIYLLFIGAVFFFAWIATIILAALAIFFHKKYRKWQNAVPSSANCPKCGSSMVVKKASEVSSTNTSGNVISSIVEMGSSHIWNKNGEIMVCESCGYQENRLTQETIDIKTKRYKTRRIVATILFVIALVLSIRFTYWLVKFNSGPSDTTNTESVSAESSDDIIELAYDGSR